MCGQRPIYFTSGRDVRQEARIPMKTWRFGVALLVVLATAVGIAQTTAKRSVVLQLDLPNGATPQVRVLEGETATVTLPRVGTFGFVPTLQEGSNVVLVDVFDLEPTPHQRLGRVEATVGGDTVQSNTKPQFGVRVTKVIAQ